MRTNVSRFMVGKSIANRRSKNDIVMNLKEVNSEARRWLELARDRVQLRGWGLISLELDLCVIADI
jgi:hypothetical protein